MPPYPLGEPRARPEGRRATQRAAAPTHGPPHPVGQPPDPLGQPPDPLGRPPPPLRAPPSPPASPQHPLRPPRTRSEGPDARSGVSRSSSGGGGADRRSRPPTSGQRPAGHPLGRLARMRAEPVPPAADPLAALPPAADQQQAADDKRQPVVPRQAAASGRPAGSGGIPQPQASPSGQHRKGDWRSRLAEHKAAADTATHGARPDRQGREDGPADRSPSWRACARCRPAQLRAAARTPGSPTREIRPQPTRRRPVRPRPATPSPPRRPGRSPTHPTDATTADTTTAAAEPADPRAATIHPQAARSADAAPIAQSAARTRPEGTHPADAAAAGLARREFTAGGRRPAPRRDTARRPACREDQAGACRSAPWRGGRGSACRLGAAASRRPRLSCRPPRPCGGLVTGCAALPRSCGPRGGSQGRGTTGRGGCRSAAAYPHRDEAEHLFAGDPKAERTLAVIGDLAAPGAMQVALRAAREALVTGRLVAVATTPGLGRVPGLPARRAPGAGHHRAAGAGHSGGPARGPPPRERGAGRVPRARGRPQRIRPRAHADRA